MSKASTGAAPDFDQLPELDQAVESRLRPEIRPRSNWADQRQPTGPLVSEEDVRFLIVHHTASANDYRSDDVIEQIQDFYDFHVGPERGWPDVAYNFLIDRFGGIWEARQGSLDNAVRGDATGGSQGFAQLASLIGNHVEVSPTPEALDSLARLLAWLAHRYRVDTAPGSTVTFVSQGSNLWPAGAEVTARTISGHRDMSETTCPGEPVYALLARSLPEQVEQFRQTALIEASAELGIDLSEPADSDGPTASNPDPNPDRTSATIGSEAVDVGTDGVAALGESAPVDDSTPASAVGGDDDAGNILLPAGATLAAGAVAGLIALRRRRLPR